MDSGTRPLGKRDHPPDRFDLGHGRTRSQMRKRVGASHRLQLEFAARHDRRIFRVHHRAYATRSKCLKAFEQRAVSGCGQVAEGVADKGLETGGAGIEERFQPVYRVIAEECVNAIVDIRRSSRFKLQSQRFNGAGRRVGVWHFKHGSDATTSRCG